MKSSFIYTKDAKHLRWLPNTKPFDSCEKASQEQDSDQLMVLIAQITRFPDETETNQVAVTAIA